MSWPQRSPQRGHEAERRLHGASPSLRDDQAPARPSRPSETTFASTSSTGSESRPPSFRSEASSFEETPGRGGRDASAKAGSSRRDLEALRPAPPSHHFSPYPPRPPIIGRADRSGETRPLPLGEPGDHHQSIATSSHPGRPRAYSDLGAPDADHSLHYTAREAPRDVYENHQRSLHQSQRISPPNLSRAREPPSYSAAPTGPERYTPSSDAFYPNLRHGTSNQDARYSPPRSSFAGPRAGPQVGPIMPPKPAQASSQYAVRISHTNSPICSNCQTTATPLWRRDGRGGLLCKCPHRVADTHQLLCLPLIFLALTSLKGNACGLFARVKGRSRPVR
ncbi:hypothetical protein IE81DRAFT_29598 [Ceraceosorus guamensis]|uniref:GATA-type domain-containing protein n=1 Tax=Ceraceosorus guamensis TaxID=1522189 RepID=A0A316W3K2_9BASI|nr:hypothetical protein IE81DRAFT_29598 [Ceraceosorus guamensis]PWN44302.1 hypothetical protein IE81DRAFT_29598 [Ceraceosorus guamensis]